MLRTGYANRGRDEWIVHGRGSKDLEQANEHRKRIPSIKFAQLRGFTFLKQTGNKDRDCQNQISGNARSS